MASATLIHKPQNSKVVVTHPFLNELHSSVPVRRRWDHDLSGTYLSIPRLLELYVVFHVTRALNQL